MLTEETRPPRYDLIAFNLVLAVVAALPVAAVGSSLQVEQLLDGLEIAGLQIDLAVGVAVNLGVISGQSPSFSQWPVPCAVSGAIGWNRAEL